MTGGPARTEFSDEEYKALLEAEDFVRLGWYFWSCFTTLKKDDPLRAKASERWENLTAKQKKACEGLD